MSNNNVLEGYFFVTLLGLLVFQTLFAVHAAIKLTLPNAETFSFQCQHQMVKVDSIIYHVDRLRASLKSNYFEKLFTSGDFKQKSDKVLEIQPKRDEVFLSVIELIHGKELIDVLNKDNYFLLLEAMDHLEMEIDLTIVSRFIDDNLKSYSLEDTKTLELYDFVRKNDKFEYLLTSVFKKLSNNLTTVHNRETLLSLTLDHLIRIINSVENVTDEKRCEIIRTCAKWLCSDFENRLPHMAILVNSIKPGFHSAGESDENNGTSVKCLPKTNVDEKAKEKITARCLFALLAYGGKLNPTILRREDLFRDECPGYHTEYEHDNEEKRRKKYEEYEVYEQRGTPPTSVNRNDECAKLKKFLQNGDFYDITVRVGEKACKLHRAVLESRCGYFADIFRTEYAEAVTKCGKKPTCPCKEIEYLLDEVDQSTFDAVIDFIYFDKHVAWESNGVGQIFKTANILRIDSLLDILKERLIDNHENVSSSDVVQIMNCTRGKKPYENLHFIYFCEHLGSRWPEIDNSSQFGSISWPFLENVTKSPHFRLDDPHKILDICSTWVHYDVKNRYCFLPRIAQTINPHCAIDRDEFMAEAPADLAHRSQQFIRDKLWNILSTNYDFVASEESRKSEPKMPDEIPAFITAMKENTIVAWNIDLDEIASFSDVSFDWRYGGIFSAAMINRNLFVLWYYHRNFVYDVKFLVYNFSSKKLFPLPFDGDKSSDDFVYDARRIYTLLNCKNEIFCCSTQGSIKKFSMQLNRWTIISNRTSKKEKLSFTSDGERIYRMYKVSLDNHNVGSYVVEIYDFEKDAWNGESSLPVIKDLRNPQQLTIANGSDLTISVFSEIVSSDRESKTWLRRKLPDELCQESYYNLFAQYEDRMVYVTKKKLFNFSPSNDRWELKKELPFEYSVPLSVEPCPGYIVPIHRPTIRANQSA